MKRGFSWGRKYLGPGRGQQVCGEGKGAEEDSGILFLYIYFSILGYTELSWEGKMTNSTTHKAIQLVSAAVLWDILWEITLQGICSLRMIHGGMADGSISEVSQNLIFVCTYPPLTPCVSSSSVCRQFGKICGTIGQMRRVIPRGTYHHLVHGCRYAQNLVEHATLVCTVRPQLLLLQFCTVPAFM